MDAKLKVRQPLASVEVSLADDKHMAWLSDHDEIVRKELNVKDISYNAGNSPYIAYQILPNFKKLGPKLGKQLPAVKKALGQADGADLLAQLRSAGQIEVEVDRQSIQLDSEDIEVRLQAKSGWTASQGKYCVVVLSTDLTPELIREGYSRDLVRLIQDSRKQKGCQFTDRIHVYLRLDDAELMTAINENQSFISGETLATDLMINGSVPDAVVMNDFEIDGRSIGIGIEVVRAVLT